MIDAVITGQHCTPGTEVYHAPLEVAGLPFAFTSDLPKIDVSALGQRLKLALLVLFLSLLCARYY
jgi:hypothetical protein